MFVVDFDTALDLKKRFEVVFHFQKNEVVFYLEKVEVVFYFTEKNEVVIHFQNI